MGFIPQNSSTYNSPGTLSGSQGGEPIVLDDASVPGKVIHANASDSGVMAVLQGIRVRNENAITLPGWWIVQGGTLPVPASRNDMYKGYVQGAGEIKTPSDEPFPPVVLLAPGYTLYVSADVTGKPLTISGAVDLYPLSDESALTGYGGLITATTQSLGTITAGTWITVPFLEGSVGIPVNVVQDTANDALAITLAGVWAVTSYATIEFTKLTNADRIINFRYWNKTKESEVSDSPFPLYVEQGNTGGSFTVPAVPRDIATSIENDLIELQLGGSTTDFTGVSLNKAGFNVFKIG